MEEITIISRCWGRIKKKGPKGHQIPLEPSHSILRENLFHNSPRSTRSGCLGYLLIDGWLNVNAKVSKSLISVNRKIEGWAKPDTAQIPPIIFHEIFLVPIDRLLPPADVPL